MHRHSPFMVDLFHVRRPESLGAVTHVDGTARVQTVEREVAPRYLGLIRRFGELTGYHRASPCCTRNCWTATGAHS